VSTLFKISASYIGSGLWWLTQQLYGDRIFKWCQPMIPDWVTNPSLPTIIGPDVSALAVFSHAPPVLLIGLGTYFVFRDIERTNQGYPGLEVFPNAAHQGIGSSLHHAVNFTFTNKTGSALRLSYPQLKENQGKFPIPSEATKNLTNNFRELKFINSSGVYADDERTLQINDRVQTSMAVSHAMSPDFYTYRPGPLRKLLRWPKYFHLRYTVTVDDKKHTCDIIF
jgi:hypothetical protein